MFESIAKNIKEYRKKSNLTQKELGSKIYKSEILIRKYESGKVNIPPSTLFDICTALNISIETLLGDDYEKYHMLNFTETSKSLMDTTKRAVSIAEDLQRYGDSWRDAVTNIENSSNHLLNTILSYMENTEEYYSSLFVNTENTKDDSLPYLTNSQVDDIVKKITELVKYEIYKIENKI